VIRGDGGGGDDDTLEDSVATIFEVEVLRNGDIQPRHYMA
jgi:hypothetical protein